MRRTERLSLFLLGLGLGLLASLLLPGGFLRIVIGVGLISVSLIVSNCS